MQDKNKKKTKGENVDKRKKAGGERWTKHMRHQI